MSMSNKDWAHVHEAMNRFSEASVKYSWLGSRPKDEHFDIVQELHDARQALEKLIALIADAQYDQGYERL
jgi:hypothetical protein